MNFSDEYLALCIENEEILERFWEPKFGELVLCWDVDAAEWSKDLWLVIGRYSEDAVDVFRERDGAIGAALIVDCAPLPSQRQLIELLEERGYGIVLYIGLRVSTVRLMTETTFLRKDPDDDSAAEWRGPDPETALLRAWLEVVKNEGA